MKGIEIEIPPDIAASLRDRPQHRSRREDDEWNQVIRLPSTGHPTEGESEDRHHSQGSDYNDDEETDGTNAFPAPVVPNATTLPLVVIDIAKLQGFPASSLEEALQIKDHLHESIKGSTFIQTVRGLFEVGVATHGELAHRKRLNTPSSGLENPDPNRPDLCTNTDHAFLDSPQRLVFEYPDRLGDETKSLFGDEASFLSESCSTQHQWNLVSCPHSIPVVDRLFRHIKNCHRDLLWKYELRTLLQEWVQERQLLEWKTRRRQEQLDQLYQVREAFELRILMAEQQVVKYEHELDEKVRASLQQRRLVDIMVVGGEQSAQSTFEDFNIDNTAPCLFMFGADGQSENDSVDDDQQAPLISDSSSGENDCYASSSENGSVPSDSIDGIPSSGMATETTAQETTQTSLSKQERRRERQRAKKRLQEQESLEQQRRAELRAAREKHTVRESLTSHEHKAAMAVITSLQSKLQHVDELIESLQEEQWEDDDKTAAEGEDVGGGENDKLESFSTLTNTDLTLMDQILAMVLSSLGKAVEEDFVWLRDEHLAIKAGWFQFFGTLPKLPSQGDKNDSAQLSEQSSAEKQQNLRACLGITEYVWDEEEDTEKKAVHCQKVGLRPGGRVP